jgi:type IV pilus assembly protein PilP
MSKHTFFIRIAVCLLSLLILLFGCQEKPKEPEKAQKVVSQKIAKKITKTTAEPKAPKEAKSQPTAKAVKAPSKVAPLDSKGSTDTEKATASTTESFDTQNLIPDLAMGYDPKGRIDPFIPLVRDEPVKVEKKELVEAKGEVREVRTKTPLEKIEISQLRLRAIIMAASGNRALVEESNGKGYIITKGTYIGRNEGKVTAILKDKVVVEELVENIEGKMITQEKEMKLPKPPGEE